MSSRTAASALDSPGCGLSLDQRRLSPAVLALNSSRTQAPDSGSTKAKAEWICRESVFSFPSSAPTGRSSSRSRKPVPGDLWRKLRLSAYGARLCLEQHKDRMKADPEYRETFDHLVMLGPTLAGRWGQTVRIVAVGHTLRRSVRAWLAESATGLARHAS